MPLILTVTPRGPKGVFVGHIKGTELRLIASRNPMLSAARSLIYCGVDPGTVLTLRWSGSSVDRLSGRLDTIVRKAGKAPRRAVQGVQAKAPRVPARGLPARSGEDGPP